MKATFSRHEDLECASKSGNRFSAAHVHRLALALRRSLCTDAPTSGKPKCEDISEDARRNKDLGRTFDVIKSEQALTAASRLGAQLTLRNVAKAFADRPVLHEITLDIAPGQFVAIVGRSGGGKTTLLRLMAGLEHPSSGVLLLDDKPLAGQERDVRLLFQDARLLPWQTVLENVGIARGRNWRETALRALSEVGLESRQNEWPSILSGGQKQRVALARALVSRPKIMLLDEPFGALDALTRVEMYALTERIWQEHGFTTVLITHDVTEALTLADRVLVLREGKIAFDRTIDWPRPRKEDAPILAEMASLRAAILQHV